MGLISSVTQSFQGMQKVKFCAYFCTLMFDLLQAWTFAVAHESFNIPLSV